MTTTTTTTRLEKKVHSIIKRLIFLPQGQLSNNNKKILELSYRTLFALENQIYPSVEQCKKVMLCTLAATVFLSDSCLRRLQSEAGRSVAQGKRASERASKASAVAT
jgi:hypothetical protein